MNASSSTYINNGATGHAGGWLSQIAGKLQNLRARLAERRKKASEMRELYRFSDRELWDIGLSRSDFHAIEQGTFRRD